MLNKKKIDYKLAWYHFYSHILNEKYCINTKGLKLFVIIFFLHILNYVQHNNVQVKKVKVMKKMAKDYFTTFIFS